ncbi:MAG: GIY-YIG nuclease family protein [Bacteroidales bacterium]|nr:GIY-YIG nuclease family protein [Bacteroidales bacterium]
MYYIYILYSESSDKYYIGHTDNIDRRLLEHNFSERNTYTSKYRPWILKATYSCGNKRSIAMKIEKIIKQQKNRNFIKKLIDGVQLYGDLAQLIRVPHLRD